MSAEEYIESLIGTYNDVWNSPARQFFNPIEMSYQAPFVDAATSVDPVNRENTFISYYAYGSVLGLALDLSLRQKKLNLDDFMKLVWQSYGKTETPYTIENLHGVLNEYAGKAFGDAFFRSYIYKSDMPDYKSLLESVGVVIARDREIPYLGVDALLDGDGNGSITSNAKIGSPAYKAGLDKGDVIIFINGAGFPHKQQFADYIKQFKISDTLQISFERFGIPKKVSVVLEADPDYSIQLMETAGKEPSNTQKQNRKEWLKIDYQ
jgi:predicted metalloprotease with PDZ domain